MLKLQKIKDKKKNAPVLPDLILRLVPRAGTKHSCSFPFHIHVSCESHHGLLLNNCHCVPVASADSPCTATCQKTRYLTHRTTLLCSPRPNPSLLPRAATDTSCCLASLLLTSPVDPTEHPLLTSLPPTCPCIPASNTGRPSLKHRSLGSQ